MAKITRYKVELYKLKKTHEKSIFKFFTFHSLVYKDSVQYIRLSSMSHVFRKKLSKKYIESIRKEAKNEKYNTLIFDDKSCKGGKETLKKNYDKIKTYEIP